MILFQSKRKQELSKKDPAEQAEAFQNLGLKLGSLENLANLGETLQLDVEVDRFSGDFTTRAWDLSLVRHAPINWSMPQ